MFDKLKQMGEDFARSAMESMQAELQQIEPERFNDEFALQIEWCPCSSSASNMKTSQAIRENSDRVVIGWSTQGKIFCYVFMLLGALASIGGIGAFLTNQELAALLVPLLIGLTFFAVGYFMLASPPYIFDKRHGLMWCDKRSPDAVRSPSELKLAIKLEDIYALQILARLVTSSSGSGSSRRTTSYVCYDLNIVESSGNRTAIESHNALGSIKNDARIISELLEIPVWDASHVVQRYYRR